MNKINTIIFGTGKIADVAYYYLSKSPTHNILGFTLQKDFIKNSTFKNLPIIDYDDIEKTYSPKDVQLFAPCPASKLNKFREEIYNIGKKKGYSFTSYISPDANVNTNDIGENCFIFEQNNIQPYTKIGNNCILWSGNHIGHHSVLEDNIFITSHVVISGNCNIKKNSYIGVNASLRDGLIINDYSIIGMGAVVTKNTEQKGIYLGNPAKLIKFADDNTNL